MPWREDFDTFIGENAFRRDFAPQKRKRLKSLQIIKFSHVMKGHC